MSQVSRAQGEAIPNDLEPKWHSAEPENSSKWDSDQRNRDLAEQGGVAADSEAGVAIELGVLGYVFCKPAQLNVELHKAPPRNAESATAGSCGDGAPRRSLLSSLHDTIAQQIEAAAPADGDVRTDEQLMDDYRKGDAAAFHSIIGRYRQELYFFLFRFMHDQPSTEDGLQETFLRVHQFADQFDACRAFRPWLFSIAANWARDVIRTRCRKSTVSLQLKLRTNDRDGGELSQLIAADVEAPDDRMKRSEVQNRVQSTLQSLPGHLRHILDLAYFQQFCYQEIATAMGIPVGTVKSRLHAAVGHFAEQWEQRHGTVEGPRRAARSRRPSMKRPPLPANFSTKLLP